MKEPQVNIALLNRCLLFLISLLLLPLVTYSQVGKLFSTDAELSSSLINQIYQDDKGYIWIATEDGLDRYDGAKISIFKQDKQDSTSILNNYVKSIYQDSDGVLYFGFFNGLQYFNHATEEFHEIPLFIENNFIYPAHVTGIIERKNGDILISSSGQGIFKLKQENGKLIGRKLTDFLPSKYFEGIFEDSKQNLWALSQDQGLFKISPNGKIKEYFEKNDQTETQISSICEVKNGKIYVGSLSRGLFQYNAKSDAFNFIKDSENLPIKTLFVNKQNELMIGTDGRGLKVYDPVKEKMSVRDFSIVNFDFSKTKVHAIIQDKADNLWLGIYQKGMLLIPDKINNFNYIGYQSVKNNLIGSNSVMSVFKDNRDMLWVGTDGDGLYGISEQLKQEFHVGTNKVKGSTSIMSLYQDSENNVWIGTYLQGLALLDRKNKRLNFVDGLKDQQNNPVERIYSILEDQRKTIWIGSLGYGLYSYDLNKEIFKNHNIIENGTTYDRLHNKWINCLLLSKANKLYIGTYDGLATLDLEDKTYLNQKGQNHMLGNKIVYSLYEDKDLNLWIGTSEGLFYKPKNDTITQLYTTADGLPSNVISAIEADSNNDLWISTNHGISKLELQTKAFKNYYFKDGLQGNEFNKNASYYEKDGLMFFGSTNGVTYFDPAEITSSDSEIDLKITGFYLEDKLVKKGMKSGPHSILEKAIIEADTIELASMDNDFSIEFSSFEFKNQQWISYSYSLNSEDWVKLLPGIHTVTFNNLEPGTYNFKVKAKDYGEFSPAQQLTIIIHQPWYFSIWAKVIYLFLIIIIAYIIAQQIIQRKKTRKKLQEHLQSEQINEAKLQFLTNISHDIKTPISLIINPLHKLLNTDPQEERQKLYRVMERNSERILQLIDQLLNARKLDNGQLKLKFKEIEIIGFAKAIIAIFEDQIESKKINFKIHNRLPEIYAWIDPNHFDKIIQNTVSNAIKFTPEGGTIEVSIDLEEGKDQFHIIVKDNGIGIQESEINEVFNRFYQISNPESRPFKGTGIGLHLTKAIVELHHGSIKAENNKNEKGCKFIIKAPLGKLHLNEEDLSTTEEINKNPATINQVEGFPEENIKTTHPDKNRPILLIVDDDHDIRNYIAEEFKTQYNILKSTNGKKAFPLVLKYNPDLIISDVKMPEMDGIAFTRKVKKNININHIPIILLTGKTDKETNLEGLDIGADAYLNKPFHIDILKKTAKNLIRNRELLKNTYSGNQLQEDKIQRLELKSGDEALLEKFMEVVNKNINNNDLNVEMIASELGISRVHLYRKLKQLTNQSAGELITNIRLKQAGDLLISKKINVAEVAYAVGFSSTSKFSTKFKEFYGLPPSTYREKNKLN